MGALRDATGRVINLPTRLLVGRGLAAGLRLAEPSVSSEHAVLASRGGAWTLRDLGSANGTFVNGDRLAAGEVRRLIAGDVLCFAPVAPTFCLVDADLPRVFATRLRDGLEVVGSFEVLGLPSPDRPTLQVMPAGVGWVSSSERGDYAISDGDVVDVGGEVWRVFVPGTEEETPRPSSAALVQQLHLNFRVSTDEETVLIEIRLPRGAVRLESRAHNYVLLHLARQRQRDAALSAKDQGWVDRTTLAGRLHLDPEHLNVQLFRIRRAFAEAGVLDAGNLVECRRRPGQVRIGVSDIQIESLDGAKHANQPLPLSPG